jgi:hypothetical protein
MNYTVQNIQGTLYCIKDTTNNKFFIAHLVDYKKPKFFKIKQNGSYDSKIINLENNYELKYTQEKTIVNYNNKPYTIKDMKYSDEGNVLFELSTYYENNGNNIIVDVFKVSPSTSNFEQLGGSIHKESHRSFKLNSVNKKPIKLNILTKIKETQTPSSAGKKLLTSYCKSKGITKEDISEFTIRETSTKKIYGPYKN